MVYQFIILRLVFFSLLGKLSPLPFKAPPLHLLVSHELYGTVTDAEQS